MAGSFSSHGKSAAAEFAEQVLQMPGVVHPPTRLAPDAFQMPKADDDFHLRFLVVHSRVAHGLRAHIYGFQS